MYGSHCSYKVNPNKMNTVWMNASDCKKTWWMLADGLFTTVREEDVQEHATSEQRNAAPRFRNIFSKTAHHPLLESWVSKTLSANSFLPVSSILFDNHVSGKGRSQRASWILIFFWYSPSFQMNQSLCSPLTKFSQPLLPLIQTLFMC